MAEQAAPPRQFVAHPGSRLTFAPSSSGQTRHIITFVVCATIALVVLAALFTVVFLNDDQQRTLGEALLVATGTAFTLTVILGGGVGIALWGRSAARSQQRTILIGATSGGMTVDERPGILYPLSGAALGTWAEGGAMMTGSALHFHSGPQRFAVGGRDHRLSAGTRLGAPAAAYVDAWVSASDFDLLLDATGLRNRLGVRPPAPGEPIRCALYPNPLGVQAMGVFAVAQKSNLLNSAARPVLIVDVGAEAIWVKDADTDALLGSAWRSQVTATIATYRPSSAMMYGYQSYSVAPQLTLEAPSLRPLRVACLDGSLGAFSYLWLRQRFTMRFAWRGDVQDVPVPADYAVSAADWRTLVDAFGLMAYLEERV